MSSHASLQPAGSGELELMDSTAGLQQLPKRQGLWIAGSMGAGILMGLTSLWLLQPEIAITLTIAAGASVVHPRRWWAAPLVAAGVTLAGLACFLLGVPSVVGAGAAAGALATLSLPQRTDWIDVLHGSLGTLAGSAIGLWAATALLPAALPVVVTSALTAGLVALLGSQGLLPATLRFEHTPQLPTVREIHKALKPVYRAPVFQALELYAHSQSQAPDADTRRGLAEIATWVFRNQQSRQQLEGELDHIDPGTVRARIAQYSDLPRDMDEFTRDRPTGDGRAISSACSSISICNPSSRFERKRSDGGLRARVPRGGAGRAGTVARKLPGETITGSVARGASTGYVSQAREGDARRRTARELSTAGLLSQGLLPANGLERCALALRVPSQVRSKCPRGPTDTRGPSLSPRPLVRPALSIASSVSVREGGGTAPECSTPEPRWQTGVRVLRVAVPPRHLLEVLLVRVHRVIDHRVCNPGGTRGSRGLPPLRRALAPHATPSPGGGKGCRIGDVGDRYARPASHAVARGAPPG